MATKKELMGSFACRGPGLRIGDAVIVDNSLNYSVGYSVLGYTFGIVLGVTTPRILRASRRNNFTILTLLIVLDGAAIVTSAYSNYDVVGAVQLMKNNS